MSIFFSDESVEGADTSASGYKFQGLMTQCEILYITGVLFIVCIPTDMALELF